MSLIVELCKEILALSLLIKKMEIKCPRKARNFTDAH